MPALPFEAFTRDRTALRGELWPGGPDWVVMVHDFGADLDCWRPLVGPLLRSGHTVALLDLRGHGTSDGTADPTRLAEDVSAAVGLPRQHSASSVTLVAAGLTAAAALSAEVEPRPDCLVLLSPRLGDLDSHQLRGEGTVKLFVVGATDPESDRVARELRGRSIGAAGVISFATETQGADLLLTTWRDQVIEQTLGIINTVRLSPTPGSTEGETK